MVSSAFSPPLFLLSVLFSFLLTSAAPSAIKLPLYPFAHHHHPSQPADPYQMLNRLAVTSLARARCIKHPERRHDEKADDVVKSPLFPRSYGGYSVSMGFGTPPQTFPFEFDTGSSLVWFPCTSRYLCSRCDFPNVDASKIPKFVPKNSTSAKIVGCKNPKCRWIFGSGAKCGKCDPKNRNCTEACPQYIVQYGLGSTAGILLSETLSFTDRTVPDFLVGCSIVSNRQPAGIAGFGRGSESLPSQLRLKKFSYCLVSRRFDDSPVSSDLVLETGSGDSDTKTKGLRYTPFRKNPNAFKDYYYVNLRRIVVGERRLNIPYKFLEPGSDGSGGSIVDSGSTFTFMEQPIFELVAKEFETQVRNLSRAVKIEKRTGLSPCFDISGEKTATTKIPSLKFEFKGGAEMELPLSNYFSLASNDVVCLTILSNSEVEPTAGDGGGGPAIILGSFQLQNYSVEFDLENERFGFAEKRCA